MKINVLAIAKSDRDCYWQICERFEKMAGRYATIESRDLFNTKVTKAQENGAKPSQKIYAELFKPWRNRGYTVALDPVGKTLDTPAFARLLQNRPEVTFFIGGAYGHSRDFIQNCDRVVSLSPLTMSHKVAKVVLYEQIYRALTIVHGHPYHK